jgi:pyruvate ferredoxin oxidoreductase alpha subunit
MPEVYTEAKKALDEALKASLPVIDEAWKEFGDQFGRYYKPVETYKSDDAETLLITMGSISETAMTAIDAMREKGKSVGLVRLRLWRPFPFDAFFEAVKDAKRLAVIDRAMSFSGGSGPVCVEVKSTLYDRKHHPYIQNFLAGLGGRDVTVENFEEMADSIVQSHDKNDPMGYEIINVRE